MTILTLTLNPAFDMHCRVADFKACHENLVTVFSRDVGGKGVNISRALTKNGVKNRAFIVLGRENAADFRDALAFDGIEWREIEVEGRIRENITIHTDTADETRISFAGFSMNASVLAQVRDALTENDLSSCVVTFTGRVPDGIFMEDVKRFLLDLRARGARLVIDSKSFLLDDLMECRPWLIKPNEEEIAAYLGRKIDAYEEVADIALEWHRTGIENVMISLGGKGAMLACNEGIFSAVPPSIEPLSTIGAGDSSIAGFLAAAKQGCSAEECLRYAVAYGSAACLTAGTQPPRSEDITWILQKIRCGALFGKREKIRSHNAITE